MELSKLKEPFPAKDIEWRVQRSGVKSGKPWAMVLAYVTNRAIMERLDDVCGPENWKNYFEQGPDGGILCGISVKCGGEWVTKYDGAANTDIESVKGGLSSAMKRAGSQWGIGRYLYNLDTGFANIDKNGRFSAKAKDGGKDVWFKWNEPALPKWALPSDEEPAKHPDKQPEKSAIDRCIAKMKEYRTVESFQNYLDKHWSQVEHAFKDDKKALGEATKFMTKHLNQLAEKDNG